LGSLPHHPKPELIFSYSFECPLEDYISRDIYVVKG